MDNKLSDEYQIISLNFAGGIIMLYRPNNEEGQGLVEYALILVLVAVVVIIILAVLGPTIGNVFSSIINSFNS
jgi:pilus assembly protein Flp/PilA